MVRYREAESGWVNSLLRYARGRDIPLLSYRDYYDKRVVERDESAE